MWAMKACSDFFFSWIFPWFPKRLMSRAVGVLMRLPHWPLTYFTIPVFAKIFKIDLSLAERRRYISFDDFFTRRLKPGARPIQGSRIHPVDGVLSTKGVIQKGELVQAKGWTYSLAEFLGDAELAQAYEGGSYGTYYLCPADYHRVHAPHTGGLASARHIPGLLWPVNQWSVTNIKRLFCLNERVVLNFVSPEGRFTVVMVGATNVGHMTITPDPSIVTNRWLWHAPTDRTYTPPLATRVGDEIGIFHLGSTVVCLYEKGFPEIQTEIGPVKMGEKA